MSGYLMIASRDPFEWNGAARFVETAAGLAREGNKVTLFLVQNGVLASRPCQAAEVLKTAADSGVEILADDFSLAERGINNPVDCVKSAKLDTVIDQMVEGRKTMWF